MTLKPHRGLFRSYFEITYEYDLYEKCDWLCESVVELNWI